MNFAEDVYKKEVSFDEAKNEQKEMLQKIKELKKRVDPPFGLKPKKKKQKK